MEEGEIMTRLTAIVAAAGLALTSFATADSDWAAAASGSWTVALNWSPADVPDTALELATIAVGPGAYTVTLGSGLDLSIAGLVLSNPMATLDIQGGRTLIIAGGVFSNDGLVRIDSNGSSADGVLRFDVNTAHAGTGIMRLNSNSNARLETGAGAVLTNNARIEGGGIIHADLINNAIVEATGVLELRTADKSNAGTMRAATGGLLAIETIAINNTGGVIDANEGTVRTIAGVSSITGGTLTSSGAGVHQVVASADLTLDAVTNNAALDIQGGGDLFITNGLTNNGFIHIDSNGSSADGVMTFVDSATLGGTGTTRLRQNPDARIETDPGVVVTIGTNQTVNGAGIINAAFINDGLIDAHLAAQHLILAGNDKVNNSVIRATGGGTINIQGVTTTQSAAGVMRGDGGNILIGSGISGITGGSVEAINGGLIFAQSAAMCFFTDVDLVGPLDLLGNSTLLLTSTLTNNGTIRVNSNGSSADAVLTTVNDVLIDGTGTILLNQSPDARLETAPATTLTIGSGQTVTGAGHIHARLINNGIVQADNGGSNILLLSEPKTNNNLMRANAGATLNISTVTTTQHPSASMVADGGTVLVNSAPTALEQGALSTINGGLVRIASSGNLRTQGVTFTGDLNIEGNGTLTVDTALTNNGTIVVDSNGSIADAFLTTVADALIDGTGLIHLNQNPDARITTPGGATLTMGAGQTIDGRGIIDAQLVNNGLIDANSVGGAISFATNSKTNNAIMRASAGVLDITGVTTTQSGGGIMEATDGGQVRVSASGPTRVEGGTLRTSGTGFVRLSSSAGLTLDGVAFDGLMNMEGNSILTAEGTLTNNGSIVVNSNGSAADAEVVVADGSSVLGSGAIDLLRGNSDSRLSTPGTATIGASQTVTGLGRLDGSWVFRGTLAPGNDAVGAMFNEGTLSMRPTTNMAVEIASNASNGFDRLLGAGVVELDGTLDISFLGYTPVKNHVFRIVNGSSVTGQFETVNGPALTGGLVYAIFYAPTFAELRITCGPDLNLDGVLDFFDVLYFLQEYSAGNPDGDYNDDGIFDFFDVLAFLQAFAAPCP